MENKYNLKSPGKLPIKCCISVVLQLSSEFANMTDTAEAHKFTVDISFWIDFLYDYTDTSRLLCILTEFLSVCEFAVFFQECTPNGDGWVFHSSVFRTKYSFSFLKNCIGKTLFRGLKSTWCCLVCCLGRVSVCSFCRVCSWTVFFFFSFKLQSIEARVVYTEDDLGRLSRVIVVICKDMYWAIYSRVISLATSESQIVSTVYILTNMKLIN